MFFYLHIPFCRQKCHYCKFAITPVFDAMKVRTYIDAIKREIKGFFTENPDVSVETIYFGGGTPSILTSEQIDEILAVFRNQKWSVNISEITLESNPEDITSEYLEALSNLWVNRLSLGVQTLGKESLRAVGRSDSNEYIFRALDTISKGPIENISVDFIAGLPHTRSGDTLRDATFLLDRFPIQHMSIYMLENSLYPSEWKDVSLDEERVVQEYLDTRAFLIQRGFNQYELSNFALPGYESKHNQSYWNHSDVRAFGLGAASYWEGKRFANSTSFTGYYQGKREYEEVLSDDAKRIERIMFGLRSSGMKMEDVGNHPALDRYIAQGVLEIRNNRVFPTSTWIFLLDHIMGELI